MITNIQKKHYQFVKRYQWLGILVVSLLSIPLHFAYEWTGKNFVVGLFTPINESIWEHLNLVFWPILIWWGIGYTFFRKKKQLSFEKWLPAAATSAFASMIFIVAWYYIWAFALNIESSFTNLASLFIAGPISQLIGIHLYKVIKPRTIYVILSSLFIILAGGAFIWFTINTPVLPIFIPPN